MYIKLIVNSPSLKWEQTREDVPRFHPVRWASARCLSVASAGAKLGGWWANFFPVRTLHLWTPHLSTVAVAASSCLPEPVRSRKTGLTRSRRHRDGCPRCPSGHFPAATPWIGSAEEATRRSASWPWRPSWAWTCAAARRPALAGQWRPCDRWRRGDTGRAAWALRLCRHHPGGQRRCRWPLCLCRCSLYPRKSQGSEAEEWHPISEGVLRKRGERRLTHARLTVLWPPPPKHIALDLQRRHRSICRN